MTTQPSASRTPIWAAAVLGLGVLLGALAFGAFFYHARAPVQSVRVVGAATLPFEADIAKWRLTLSRQVSETGLEEGYAGLRQDVERVRAALVAAGLPDSAITLQAAAAQPQWGPQGRSGYVLQQPLFVVSERPEQLEALAFDPGPVLGGAALEFSQLEYFYSAIAELKHSLLAEATRDARRRAEEIAGSTEGAIGKLVSARAGVFQITEPLSTEVSGAGLHSTSTRKKEITVTVHADFTLR